MWVIRDPIQKFMDQVHQKMPSFVSPQSTGLFGRSGLTGRIEFKSALLLDAPLLGSDGWGN